jgi:hypothetical protein
MTTDVMEFGWFNRPEEVAKFLPQTVPLKGLSLEAGKDTFLYNVFKEVVGKDAPKGPQGIGDCVSWGWSNLVNYLQAMQITLAKRENLLVPEYQEIATEATYAFSRVEFGNLDGSYSDGSVGAWAAEAAKKGGYLSRKYLASKGLSPDYDKDRAKQWGAKGVPDHFEADARQHVLKNVTQVRSFDEAATFIQNGYPVAVCSNRGFTMTRDSKGFCSPSGVWNHCMLFMACRFGDRPGLCTSQSWGAMTPDGPLVLGQPDNSFWADAKVVDYMLSQGDSFAGGLFDHYLPADFTDWKH